MRTRLTAACALLVALASPAYADQPVAPKPAADQAPTDAPFSEALSDDDLGDLSGGANYHLNTSALTQQTLNASSRNNSVTGDTVGSGAVTIGPDAFSGFSGIGNFVVNTGHNNTLQGSLSVQVVVVPTPGT